VRIDDFHPSMGVRPEPWAARPGLGTPGPGPRRPRPMEGGNPSILTPSPRQFKKLFKNNSNYPGGVGVRVVRDLLKCTSNP
jgi:hypothetical protein